MDNIIERPWRSITYEEVYLKAYANGREARVGIGAWRAFYNHRRPPHQAMNKQDAHGSLARWHEIEAATKTVDMPLRLNNASALPTRQQQKQPELA